MGLTSDWFLAVMVGAAVSWIAATVLVWPRLAWLPRARVGRRRTNRAGAGRLAALLAKRAGAGRLAALLAERAGAGRLVAVLAGRAGLLVGSQVLVLAAVLVWLNSYFAFYASWSELIGHSGAAKGAVVKPAAVKPAAAKTGAPPKPVKQAGHGSNIVHPPSSARLSSHWRPESVLFYGFGLGPGHGHPGLPPHADGPALHRLVKLPGAARYGMIVRVQIKGRRAGLTASSGYVFLPPQYFQRAYAHDRFPAVLALTGYPGGARSIVDRLGLTATAARLAAAGRARPVVYVMLNVSPVSPRDTECTNVPAGPQVASFFAVDVPLAVEQTFRVTTNRAGWGTLGYSTGGYCATKLAMLYPGTFSAAVSIAGYYVALRDSTTGNLYGGSSAYQDENNLDWRLLHLPAPPVSVLVTSSKVGENTYPGTLRFLGLIRPPMHVYALIHPVGGHNFGVWSQELPQTLQWLTFRLSHPTPTSSGSSRLAGAA